MPERLPNVTIYGAKLLWRNFAGLPGEYNPPGYRNFNVQFDEEMAQTLKADGWNVKWKKSKAPDALETDGIWTLEVSVGFPRAGTRIRAPRIVLITSKGRTNLGEEEVEFLDWVDIRNVDLIIRAHHWSRPDGSSGVKAWMQSIYVTIQEDELELKYADVPELSPELAGPVRRLELESGQKPDDDVIDVEHWEVDE